MHYNKWCKCKIHLVYIMVIFICRCQNIANSAYVAILLECPLIAMMNNDIAVNTESFMNNPTYV